MLSLGRPVLVIATPRSGTNNATHYLRSLGLNVTHERLGAEGERVDVVVDYHQLPHLLEWPIAIYLTREPVANVKSLGGLLTRRGQYKRTMAMLPGLPEGLSALELACHYWLHCYQTCRHLPHWKAEVIPRVHDRVNNDHEEGHAGIPERFLHALLQAGHTLGYYSQGPLLP